MSEYADKNELYHWAKGGTSKNHKYTSRYMKNGKWRYVYDTVKGAAKNLGDRVKDWYGVDELERLNKATIDYAMTGYNEKQKRKSSTPDWWADNRNTENYNRQKLNAKKNAYERAKADYYKTPMGKLDKAGTAISDTVGKGSDWVKKQSKKVKTKLSSAKKKISELTGHKEKHQKANEEAFKYYWHINEDGRHIKEDGFDRQKLNAARNSYQRSQDAYYKTLYGRINKVLTKKKKK